MGCILREENMRVFLLVIDSFGIGCAPDAAEYGDEGANTAVGIGRAVGGACWPNLQAMGLGNVAALTGDEIPGCPPVASTENLFAALRERSPGKDTTTGHWEMAGIVLEEPFHVFPSGPPSFPAQLIADFVAETGVPGILGDKAASGTEIIEELGEEHLASGKPICYTSADSVFQIAAHSDVFPLKELYRLCETARRLCDPLKVGRVIARPFEGRPGSFSRTRDRHDWSIALPGKSLLDQLQEQGVQTVAVGKIGSIFNEQGIDVSYPDAGNPACMERTLAIARENYPANQFVFVNLVDTDMIWGHRRDPQGYHDAVAAIDAFLPDLNEALHPDDYLIITADHGCDPTFKGTDHTREYVPFLFKRIGYPPEPAEKHSVGIFNGFSCVSESVKLIFKQSD
ncbi:MAG: phosphopentomutase [Spirochaeta sp. LUC14_002_19_P3]|nr:MAG: phosphopentomutase [Spirochaeta sp. LUC14_002_19_P3]